VFQGTVAEDATGGTHVCSLTVTPGAGNEMRVGEMRFTVGATATAQVVSITVDDGTNDLFYPLVASSDTTSGRIVQWPTAATAAFTGGNNVIGPGTVGFVVSGTMRLILKVSTAAVSVTQTFAVVCRIKGAPPTATLADNVGTPVLTTNTNAVFG